jgi:hypothetical protein
MFSTKCFRHYNHHHHHHHHHRHHHRSRYRNMSENGITLFNIFKNHYTEHYYRWKLILYVYHPSSLCIPTTVDRVTLNPITGSFGMLQCAKTVVCNTLSTTCSPGDKCFAHASPGCYPTDECEYDSQIVTSRSGATVLISINNYRWVSALVAWQRCHIWRHSKLLPVMYHLPSYIAMFIAWDSCTSWT